MDSHKDEHAHEHGHDHNHDHDHDHHHHSELDHLTHNHGTDIVLQGELNANIERVWEVLTSNEYVKQWFPELEFESLKAGGNLMFNSGDMHIDMMIYDVEVPSHLSFEWGEGNIVTFDLVSNDDLTTQLNYTQWIHHIDEEHSPKDVTGWLICMQKIAAVIDNKPIPDTMELYNEYYDEVEQLIKEQTSTEFE